MIVEVIKDMSAFIVIFWFTLAAFGHMFYIFFKNLTFDGDTVTKQNPFENPMAALISVYYTAVGDTSLIDYLDDGNGSFVGHFLCIL